MRIKENKFSSLSISGRGKKRNTPAAQLLGPPTFPHRRLPETTASPAVSTTHGWGIAGPFMHQ